MLKSMNLFRYYPPVDLYQSKLIVRVHRLSLVQLPCVNYLLSLSHRFLVVISCVFPVKDANSRFKGPTMK